MRNKRRKAYEKGLMAETLCGMSLRLRGYKILEKRYKTPVGEIDIVAKRGGIVAIIEVKARQTAGAAAQAVTPRNQNRVSQATKYLLAQNPKLADATIRFDAMLVTPFSWPRHHENVWELHDEAGAL